MKLRKAERKKAKIKLAIQGASGSGKTFSALLLSRGLTDSWSKIAVIDTENNSADLYAHLGDYNVLPMSSPFSPERYMKAIDACISAGAEVIILDSISHCWDYLLDHHAQLQGNSFTNWGKITPRHKAFMQKILEADVHIIATMRTKQDYVLNQKDGKYIPEKVGLKAVQRDGVDYEFTLLFELDAQNNAVSSKDRTGLFMNQPSFLISQQTGKRIKEWCNNGTQISAVRAKIKVCKTMPELMEIYDAYTDWYEQLEPDFKAQKETIYQLTNQKSISNGTTNS